MKCENREQCRTCEVVDCKYAGIESKEMSYARAIKETLESEVKVLVAKELVKTLCKIREELETSDLAHALTFIDSEIFLARIRLAGLDNTSKSDA